MTMPNPMKWSELQAVLGEDKADEAYHEEVQRLQGEDIGAMAYIPGGIYVLAVSNLWDEHCKETHP